MYSDTVALRICDYFAIPVALIWFSGGIWLLCVTLIRFCFVESADVYKPCETKPTGLLNGVGTVKKAQQFVPPFESLSTTSSFKKRILNKANLLKNDLGEEEYLINDKMQKDENVGREVLDDLPNQIPEIDEPAIQEALKEEKNYAKNVFENNENIEKNILEKDENMQNQSPEMDEVTAQEFATEDKSLQKSNIDKDENIVKNVSEKDENMQNQFPEIDEVTAQETLKEGKNLPSQETLEKNNVAREKNLENATHKMETIEKRNG